MIPLKGLQKTTLIDYPGKVACTVFVAGCNMRCPFCHNKDLVDNHKHLPEIKPKEFFDFLESRRGWIDGVCITGGEPLMYSGVKDFAKQIKDRFFLVKIDTNGTNPGLLKEMIGNKLVDYIAMDIKNAPDEYDTATGNGHDIKKIKKSVDIIKDSNVDYEFRSTVLPKLHSKDAIKKMGEWLKGSKRFFIQNFHPQNCLDAAYDKEKGFSPEELEELKKILEEYIDEVGVRG